MSSTAKLMPTPPLTAPSWLRPTAGRHRVTPDTPEQDRASRLVQDRKAESRG